MHIQSFAKILSKNILYIPIIGLHIQSIKMQKILTLS